MIGLRLYYYRCLRILRLNAFPEILQYLNIIETARSIRLDMAGERADFVKYTGLAAMCPFVKIAKKCCITPPY